MSKGCPLERDLNLISYFNLKPSPPTTGRVVVELTDLRKEVLQSNDSFISKDGNTE